MGLQNGAVNGSHRTKNAVIDVVVEEIIDNPTVTSTDKNKTTTTTTTTTTLKTVHKKGGNLDLLPDELMVDIGKLFLDDVRDYVRLSSASKGLHDLLAENPQTVREVIRYRTHRMLNNQEELVREEAKDPRDLLMFGRRYPTNNPLPIHCQTLEELGFCESVERHGLLGRNRMLHATDHMDVGPIFAVDRILREFPSAEVVVDRVVAPSEVLLQIDFYNAMLVFHDLAGGTDSCKLRTWEAKSENETENERRHSQQWVDVSMRLRRRRRRLPYLDDDDDDKKTGPVVGLELPPRPASYEKLTVTSSSLLRF